ncbi:transcriptional regulator [Piscirickettsia salmonis]|uniref:transcriptional regulator n=1 Tax=Piscirickettsia salmonis TaxID=1238 RepID=UPI0007C92063|nr:hypothetical protein A0O36_00403 [Piscirickettsiaceae bacterium NZ-RLO1]
MQSNHTSKAINKEEIGQRLKELRQLLGFTRKIIHKKYGISENTIKNWELGVTITDTAFSKLLPLYANEGVVFAPDWVRTGKGKKPYVSLEISEESEKKKFKVIPNESDEAIEDNQLFKNNDPNKIVVKVNGNYMLPVYRAGDYVGGRLKHVNDKLLESLHNTDCIVIDKNGMTYVRRLCLEKQSIKTRTKLNLACLNIWEEGGQYNHLIYDVKAVKIAPIVYHRKLKV